MFNYKYFDDLSIELIDGDRGKNYPKNDEMLEKGYCLFLNAKNVTLNGFAFDENVFITKEKDEILRKGKLNRNDIVLTTRGTIGNVGLYDDKITYDNVRINSGMLIIRNNDNNINTKYLYYQLTSPFIRNQVFSLKTGSAQPQIPITVLKKLKLIIPDKRIQDKIVRVMDSIINKLTLNNEINNNLQEVINNIFISKFVNYDDYNGDYKSTELGDIPSDWSIDSFGNIISFSNGYGWNSKDMLESYQLDTYKVFKMGNIKIGGGINKEKTKSWILKEKCSGLEQFLSKKGDVLMCMTDMKSSENPLLGHTALIDRDDEFVINQRVGLIRCDKGIKWPYIYTMTNLPFFIGDIRSKAHSGVQVNLTTSGICDTKVIIPDKYSLDDFYKNATPMYEKMFVLNNEIEYLEQLRDTLLPKLMNGEIDLDNIEI